MARAKRTVRAEARRRYRAAQATETDTLDDLADETAGSVTRRPASSPRAARAADPARRPGFMGSLQSAIGRPNFTADVRALPDIAVHSKGLWVPLLIIAVSAVLYSMPSMSRNPIVAMLAQIALTPPPMILPFLGGILAPRAGWLVGGIIGMANAVGFLVLVLSNTSTQVIPLGWTYAVTSDQKTQYAISALTSAIPFGVLVGAFAGFYRRFLASSSPARQANRANARKR